MSGFADVPFVVCSDTGAVSNDAMRLSDFGANVAIRRWIDTTTVVLCFMAEETFSSLRIRIDGCP